MPQTNAVKNDPSLDNAVIREFGLPTWFQDEDVPMSVALLCCETANKSLKDAMSIAKARGYDPLCIPLPEAGPDVVGFGLEVEGKFVPLMAKIRSD